MNPEAEASRRGSRRIRGALGLGLFALLLAALAKVRGTTSFDDPFITYTYAASFARGEGLTWNGEPALGTSTPFLALVLGVAERLFPIGVPRWGAALSWLAVGVASLSLLALGRREGWRAGAAFAAAFLPLQGFVHIHIGSELLPALAAVLVAALLLTHQRWVAAGALLALAIALRAETGVAALALAVAFGAAARRAGRPVLAPLVRVGVSAALALAAWALALFALTGAIVPLTFAAKRAQAASALHLWPGGAAIFRQAAADLPRQLFLAPPHAAEWVVAALLAGLAGLFLSAPERSPARLALLAWGPAQLALTAALGVGYYPWYAIPAFFSAALLVAQVAELPLSASLPSSSRPVLAASAAVVIALFAPEPSFWQAGGHPDPRRLAYEKVADLVAARPQRSTLAAYEVGYLGHRLRRPVLDLLGLVTPQAAIADVVSGELRANLERLAPDLLMLPLRGGALVGRTIGDAASFAAAWRLERLDLGPEVPLVVYRRAGVPGAGEVELDLLPLLGESGAPLEVRDLGYTVIVAELAAGESRTLRLPRALPATRFGTGCVCDEGDASRIALTVDPDPERDGDERVSRSPRTGAGWAYWVEELSPLPAGARLSLKVERAEGGCAVALPHLARQAAPI